MARKLGMAQFLRGDRLAALATLSPALQVAENAYSREPSAQNRRQAAVCNFYVGEVLFRNGEDAVAEPRLRKALDLYRELADSNVIVSQETSASYERALEQLATGAVPEIRQEIKAGLEQFRQ